MTADRPTGHRQRCPVCGSRKVFPSLGRLGRRQPTHDTNEPMPIAGAAVNTDMPAFAWRCRVCRTSMRPTHAWGPRAPLWKRRRPISSWMLRRGASGPIAGA